MKATLILLSLWLGAVQTVSVTNCACAACQGEDSCPGCVEQSQAAEASHDCCAGEKEEAPSKSRCVHLEPSHEVLLDAPTVPPTILETSLIVPIGWMPASDLADAPVLAETVPRPPREGPLNLLNSVLLI